MLTVEMETKPCPLGCPPDDELILVGRDLLHDLPGEFQVVRCRGCRLMRTAPRPTSESIGAYYPLDYGPYVGTRVNRRSKASTGFSGRLRAAAKVVFDTKAHALPKQKPGRMLEVGCASGNFLHEMAAKNWEVEGIEYSPEAAEEARKLGYRVHTGAVETLEKLPGSYDLVVGWMVIEHLHDPIAGLKKLATWAKPDAWLAISVPDAGALEFKMFGPRWYALQLPTHLFHYDKATIAKVLASSGWEVKAIHHQRNLGNLIASVGYWVRDNINRRVGEFIIGFPERSGRVGALVFWVPATVLSWIGQTGRMTVWARRIT